MPDKRSDVQKEIDEIVLERVKKGIELLQAKYGRDWVERISLRDLNLSSGSHCVLGQVCADQALDAGMHDGFSFGLRFLDIDGAGEKYGFDSDPNMNIEYEHLQRIWTEQIIARQRPVFTT